MNYTNEYYENKSRKRRLNAKKKRAQQLRNIKVLFSVVCFTLVVCVMVIGLSKNSTSVSAAQEPLNRYYDSVEMVYGDTLWSIAADYTDGSKKEISKKVKEIRKVNHITRYQTLKAGCSIIVPYDAAEPRTGM